MFTLLVAIALMAALLLIVGISTSARRGRAIESQERYLRVAFKNSKGEISNVVFQTGDMGNIIKTVEKSRAAMLSAAEQ